MALEKLMIRQLGGGVRHGAIWGELSDSSRGVRFETQGFEGSGKMCRGAGVRVVFGGGAGHRGVGELEKTLRLIVLRFNIVLCGWA